MAALVLGALAVPCSARAQSDEDIASARSLATQGQQALKNGKYADALDLVTRAEAVMHAPTHVLMIARADAGLGRLVAAQEAYMKLVHEDLSSSNNPTFKKAQEEGKAELAALEPRIASLKIALDNAANKKVTLKVDDREVPAALIGVYRPIDPGHHEIVAYVAGANPTKQGVDLKEGEKKDVKIALSDAPISGVPATPEDNPDVAKQAATPPAAPPDASSSKMSTTRLAIGIGGVGLGVVGAVVGSVFLAKRGSASSDGNNMFDACNPRVCTASEKSAISDKDSQAASAGTLATTFYIVGGAALVTGVVVLVTGAKKSAPPSNAAYVAPWFGGASGGLRGAF